jgi:hypothetical protein
LFGGRATLPVGWTCGKEPSHPGAADQPSNAARRSGDVYAGPMTDNLPMDDLSSILSGEAANRSAQTGGWVRIGNWLDGPS